MNTAFLYDLACEARMRMLLVFHTLWHGGVTYVCKCRAVGQKA